MDSRGSPTLYKRVRAQCCALSALLLTPPPSSTGPMRKIFCPGQAERARSSLFGPFPVFPQGFAQFQTLARSLVDGKPVHPKTTPSPPFSDGPQRGLVDPVAVIFSNFPLTKSCLRPRNPCRTRQQRLRPPEQDRKKFRRGGFYKGPFSLLSQGCDIKEKSREPQTSPVQCWYSH